ncbi:uncharacterized protein LOC133528129 isoform X4 [Cydia pomonella]|uniref:uncharacterized protein LOC133528129 isoform X4 n=1 Tax=Cydia pomonella TaxID=82600 RepID=UPI002ADDD687|nr:uncharacterized protein LOC133528129 isoform X4 [Cydia pomonella]
MAADTGMDTCSSPEITDSRKRPLDGDSENGDVKRSHFSSVQDLVTALPLANGHGNITSHFAVEPTYHFKVLVPSMVAGAIIGKGGETIAQLQKDTGARVKMSKSHDFYPGTTERACLITGSVEGIMVVLDFIMEKIKEKPELVKPFPEGVDTKMPQDRDKQVKILVPNSTAGMIIGKGGNYIKQIKEQSGSYVQISQKAKELSLQERCITVVGEKDNNKKACLMILQKVVDDPQSGSCPNVSYADVAGPVANYNPTGSPYAVPTAEVTESHALGAGVVGGSVLVNGSGLGALSLTLSLAPPGSQQQTPLTQHTLDHIKVCHMPGAGGRFWTRRTQPHAVAGAARLAAADTPHATHAGPHQGMPHAWCWWTVLDSAHSASRCRWRRPARSSRHPSRNTRWTTSRYATCLVLVDGSGLGALSLTLPLAPPGSQQQTPLTQHTLDHIKVCHMPGAGGRFWTRRTQPHAVAGAARLAAADTPHATHAGPRQGMPHAWCWWTVLDSAHSASRCRWRRPARSSRHPSRNTRWTTSRYATCLVLVDGSGLGALSLTLSLAPPGSQQQTPLTQHTLDHIKVCHMPGAGGRFWTRRTQPHAVAGAARLAAADTPHATHAGPHQGGAAAVGVLGRGHLGDLGGAGAAGEARRAGAGAARRAARRAAVRRLLPAARAGPARVRPAVAGRPRRRPRRVVRAFRGGSIRCASAPSRGAHLAVGASGLRGRRGRRAVRARLPGRQPAAAQQVARAARARRPQRQGLQERRDRRGHRRRHPRSGWAQPGGDPADVGRQHPDQQEGHVRARHAQPHRHHQRLRLRHRQRAVPHRPEDPGGGAQAHAPQTHSPPPPCPPPPPASCSSLVTHREAVDSYPAADKSHPHPTHRFLCVYNH